MNLSGLKVRCACCGKDTLYVTTDKFDPDKTPTGAMIRVSDYWKTQYVADVNLPASFGSQLECWSCEGTLPGLDGKLRIVDMPEPVVVVEDVVAPPKPVTETSGEVAKPQAISRTDKTKWFGGKK